MPANAAGDNVTFVQGTSKWFFGWALTVELEDVGPTS